MSKPVKVWGYPEFPSKSAAIRFLLEENKLSSREIIQKLNCSHQHIHLAKKQLQDKQPENNQL